MSAFLLLLQMAGTEHRRLIATSFGFARGLCQVPVNVLDVDIHLRRALS
jgi:hypothetical protein